MLLWFSISEGSGSRTRGAGEMEPQRFRLARGSGSRTRGADEMEPVGF